MLSTDTKDRVLQLTYSGDTDRAIALSALRSAEREARQARKALHATLWNGPPTYVQFVAAGLAYRRVRIARRQARIANRQWKALLKKKS